MRCSLRLQFTAWIKQESYVCLCMILCLERFLFNLKWFIKNFQCLNFVYSRDILQNLVGFFMWYIYKKRTNLERAKSPLCMRPAEASNLSIQLAKPKETKDPPMVGFAYMRRLKTVNIWNFPNLSLQLNAFYMSQAASHFNRIFCWNPMDSLIFNVSATLVNKH